MDVREAPYIGRVAQREKEGGRNYGVSGTQEETSFTKKLKIIFKKGELRKGGRKRCMEKRDPVGQGAPRKRRQIVREPLSGQFLKKKGANREGRIYGRIFPQKRETSTTGERGGKIFWEALQNICVCASKEMCKRKDGENAPISERDGGGKDPSWVMCLKKGEIQILKQRGEDPCWWRCTKK